MLPQNVCNLISTEDVQAIVDNAKELMLFQFLLLLILLWLLLLLAQDNLDDAEAKGVTSLDQIRYKEVAHNVVPVASPVAGKSHPNQSAPFNLSMHNTSECISLEIYHLSWPLAESFAVPNLMGTGPTPHKKMVLAGYPFFVFW